MDGIGDNEEIEQEKDVANVIKNKHRHQTSVEVLVAKKTNC